MEPDKRGMQGLGSAATYAKRYGLLGLAGIEPDEEADDEDDAAEKAFDLFRGDYDLPHEGELVLDFVELTEPDPEEDNDTTIRAGANQ